jgi:hypothetical protein
MNIAAILTLLLSSGACSATDFHGSDGTTLRVVVCPMTVPAAADPAPQDAPAKPVQPAVPERHV